MPSKALVLADRNPQDLTGLLAQTNPDMVLLAGDLDAWTLTALRDFPGPKLGVYGNHCRGDYFEELGVVPLHARRGRCAGLVFGGLNGCPRYKPVGDFLYTHQQMDRFVAGLGDVDVLITHCPPYGINDDPDDPVHTGWPQLIDWLDDHHPQLLVHGHTYPKTASLVTEYQSTRVAYVFGHAVIDLPEHTRVTA